MLVFFHNMCDTHVFLKTMSNTTTSSGGPPSPRSSSYGTAPRVSLPNRVTPFFFDAGGDDHPQEECGMFRVIGNPDASSLCYLGLQKLQHCREEGTGIVASDAGGKLNTYTVMGLGLVEDVFHDPTPLAKLPKNKKKYQTCS
jgi:amidophosphoribosyltransferase